VFDLAPALLHFQKPIRFVESSTRDSDKVCLGKNKTYSANFPMLSTVAGGKDPNVSDLRWRLMIAYRT
jgi:hypothetical protein